MCKSEIRTAPAAPRTVQFDFVSAFRHTSSTPARMKTCTLDPASKNFGRRGRLRPVVLRSCCRAHLH
jgi:hypothetical protein